MRYPQLVNAPVSKDLKICITIPAHNEPDILPTLQSLLSNDIPSQDFEVLIGVNHSELADERLKAQNEITAQQVEGFCQSHDLDNFHLIRLYKMPQKLAGVGHARKALMDEALIRFLSIHQNNGLIVCTDADTVVGINYLKNLRTLAARPDTDWAYAFAFEHRLDHLPAWQWEAIVKYELHLRYFRDCHDFIGHPFGYFTVGSSMAVRVEGYIKQGGMNERLAGEDFYFLQKFAKAGRLRYCPEILLHPSARPSDRVPFGTGKAVKDYETTGQYLSYNFEAIKALAELTQNVDLLYDDKDLTFSHVSASIQQYLLQIDAESVVKKLKDQSKDGTDFRSKFFMWFDAFKLMKCLHFMEDMGFKKQEVKEAYNQLRLTRGQLRIEDLGELLEDARKADRKEKGHRENSQHP